MNYRSLGRTGAQVSCLCLGTMNFGGATEESESARIIAHAQDAGINFIDTADIYNDGESERIVGRALGNAKTRSQTVLATKVYNPMGPGPNDRGLSRIHILRACEESLRRLGTDYIDLYWLHRCDFSIPPDEVLRAMDDLVRSGKVRYIGSSTFPAWKVMEYLAESKASGLARIIAEQPPYNLLDRRIENELIPLALDHGLAIVPWSPLAQGTLAGRYPVGSALPPGSRASLGKEVFNQRLNSSGRLVGSRLVAYAEERGTTAATLALAWTMNRPGITAPIVGPRTMEHLELALASTELRLTDEDRAFLDSLVPPGTAVANFHNNSGWNATRVGWQVPEE